MVRIDLKDFFPSIFKRVKSLFQSLGYNEGVATILALLATEAPRVGSRSTARNTYVAVGHRACRKAPDLAGDHQCALPPPRCASVRRGQRNRFRLHPLRRRPGVFAAVEDDLVGSMLEFAGKVIADEGFTVNDAKTAVMRPQHRQTVTGLVVN